MGKQEGATKSCLQLAYVAVIVSSLLLVRPVDSQPTSNTEVSERFHSLLNQGGRDIAANNLLLVKLFRQHMLDTNQAMKEEEQQQQQQQSDLEARLETRAAGGAKRYQGTRRIGGTIILGR
uniref:Uncharacterized protein n=1 Tax=Plectus sambesii TaxID=2011161 RepID=A0A914UXD4_9BILA